MVKLEDFVTHEDPKTKELKEAIMAGEKALNSLEEARNSFRSASNWGIFDMLGGSTLISLGKHSKIKDGQYKLDKAKDDLYAFEKELKDVEYNITNTKMMLKVHKQFFDVIAYDTLAIKQINLKDDMTEEEYDLHYLGDDGTSSFYIDLCTGTYNISSSSNKEPYVIKDNESVDFMFKQIRTNMKY